MSVNGEGGELARTAAGAFDASGAFGTGGVVLGVIGRVLGTGGGLLGVVATAGGGAVIALAAGAFVTAASFASGGEWLPIAGGASPIVV